MIKKLLLKACFLFVFLAGIIDASAQTRRITGTVTGAADGQSIPGVTVLVKGTQNGTVTDIDGKFSIQISPDSETLVFSFVGLKTKEITIGASTVINVSLETETVALGRNGCCGLRNAEKTGCDWLRSFSKK
jgi:TonB-dependent starch-binding outer membrane protein SusC